MRWTRRGECKLGRMGGGVAGVICGRRLSASAKGEVYKMVVRPAMYGLETVLLTKKNMTELKTLRFSLDRIKNEFIGWTAHVRQFGDKGKLD